MQHEFDLPDEELVWQWVENPYCPVFTGETYLQTEPPLNASSLTRWPKRLPEAGVEEMPAETIEVAKLAGVLKASNVKRVIVDTMLIEKAIAHPANSRCMSGVANICCMWPRGLACSGVFFASSFSLPCSTVKLPLT